MAVCIMMSATAAYSAEQAASAAAASDKPTIYVETKAAYTDESTIARGVLECGLPERQVKSLIDAGTGHGYNIVSNDEAANAKKGRVLKINLVDAISSGNAFIGHHKVVKVRGVLFENGKEVGTFAGSRSSRGGFGAGFKGSCAVLERCVDALAEDVAAWLEKPTETRIGE